MQIKDV